MGQDVLIVSSRKKVAIQLKELLLSSGYNLLPIVENSANLFKILQDYSPDVVLLDYNLSSNQSISEISFNLKHQYKVAVVFVCDNDTNQFFDDSYFENRIIAPFTAKNIISAIAVSLYQKKHIQIRAMEQDLFLDTISLHVWFLKETHKFKTVNQSFAGFFGVSKVDMVGSMFSGFMLSNDAVIELKENQQIFLNKKKLTIERWVTGKNGIKRLFLINKIPNLDKDGEISFVVCYARDITDERMLENKIIQKQKMESVGQLASGVAHDFNNMLTIINGYSEMLLRKLEGSEDNIEIVEEILEAGQRAEKLTGQLLAFSRRQVIKPEVVKLSQYIDNLFKMLNRIIGEHIDFVYKLDEDVSPIQIDPTQLSQVIINLVVNARDAMENSGKLIIESRNFYFDEWYCKIHPEVHMITGKYVMLSVSDTGSGIDKKVLPRLFEPFFTTKPQGKGTGMGLATVYGIVKQNNGFIWVYSELGLGTTFKVYFPACDDSRGDLTKDVESYLCSYDAQGETVFIVEDEEEIGNLIVEMLKERGYKVYFSTHPDSAIELFAEHKNEIDLLISDVIMPSLNGKDLYRKLVDIKPDLPVIFMSGYSGDVISRYGILEDDSSFIQKPIHTRELLKELRALLD